MPKSLTLNEAYLKCESGGMFLPQGDVDIEQVKTTLQIVEEDMRTISELRNKPDRFNTIYKLSYDVLHALTGALLIFHKVKSANHQCLFAYLCSKYPELELSWDFFEKVRTKRNGIHYYGTGVGKPDWKEVDLQMTVYINTMKKEIKEKLGAEK